MSEAQSDLAELLQRIREGSDDAVRTFIERYGPYVLMIIRRRLDRRLRSKFDSLDFMQDVWASLFVDPPMPDAFTEPKSLFKFLAKMARNKVIDALRQGAAQRNDVKRERSLDGSVFAAVAATRATSPTPSAIAVANEQWDQLVTESPELDQQVLDLRRQGFKQADISRRLNLHPKTVRRVLQRYSLRVVS